MGADVYLRSISDKIDFERIAAAAVAEEPYPPAAFDLYYRTAATPENGYFRDGYNAAGLLPCLGFDWTRNIAPMLTPSGLLPVDQARELREMIVAAKLDPDGAEDPLESLRELVGADAVVSSAGMVRRLKEKRANLIKLLDMSIERGEPLLCSL